MAEFSVILVGAKYEGNVGSVARVMKNFGLSDLILVDPPELSREARQKAMHAQEILKGVREYDSLDQLKHEFDFLVGTSAITGTDKNSLRVPIRPWGLANALQGKGRVGLVFGREDYGLSNEEIRLCDVFVTIPADRKYPTLSLPQSVGIILYELSRLKYADKAKGMKFREFSKKEKEVLLEKFDGLADMLYEGDFENRLVKKTFRQLIGRAFIAGREAYTLIGLFRKSAERIGKKG
ncbi:MAG: RNA methyltransferase [Candidatus Altiarchaeota archaeon]